MKSIEDIRREVAEFHQREAFGNTEADAFPAWWLHRNFELSQQDAASHCSDGANDFGLDAFHLSEETERGPVLHLLQAKFSSNRGEIKKAILGFERTMHEVQGLLGGKQPEAPQQNRVLVMLASLLQRQSDLIPRMRLQFEVLHLCPDPDETIQKAIAPARERFKDAAATFLGDRKVHFTLIGPNQIQPPPAPVHIPSSEMELRFDGAELSTSGNNKYFSGLGHLSDLVNLYERYRDHLFLKNVRFYLFGKAERGPAKHMRDTIRAICIPQKGITVIPSEQFAMFHNGVTLHAEWVQKENGKIKVRGASVLNGCQTIKNASLFYADPRIRARIDDHLWQAIQIPLRIIVSVDEDFVRKVAVGNNRQTEIRPSAFWANDELQLKLAKRFRERNIFYERQQDAFINLQRSNPKEIEEVFYKSPDVAIKIEELAQAIATVLDRPALSVAAKVSDLFEDSVYQKIFAEDHLWNVNLLIFLWNVQKVMRLALKDVCDKTAALDGLSSSRFRFPCTKILARYILKYCPELVGEYSTEVIGRVGPTHPLRHKLRVLMASQNSGLQQILAHVWADETAEGGWWSATDQECVDLALRKARVADVNVFDLAEELKEEIPQ